MIYNKLQTTRESPTDNPLAILSYIHCNHVEIYRLSMERILSRAALRPSAFLPPA